VHPKTVVQPAHSIARDQKQKYFKLENVGCRKPLVLSNALCDCKCHVSFGKYSPLNLKVVEKRSKCKKITPIFVGGTAPTFLRQFVRATYYPLLDKVWLGSVCWCPSAKPGNEGECRIYGGWIKMQVEF